MYQGKTIFAIIPAKGTSTRIPNKNMRNLCGKPLLQWTLDYCANSLLLDGFYVSSDSNEILDFVDGVSNAELIMQSESVSKKENDVMLANAIGRELPPVDFISMLQVTSPIRDIRMLDAAIMHIVDHPELNSIVSVSNKPYLSWVCLNNKPCPNYNTKKRPLSQDITKYVENGSMYLFKRDAFLRKGTRIVLPTFLWECTALGTSIDIDTEEDWICAKAVINHLIDSRRILCVPSI